MAFIEKYGTMKEQAAKAKSQAELVRMPGKAKVEAILCAFGL